MLVAFGIWGACATWWWALTHARRWVIIDLTHQQLKHLAAFATVYLMAGLILFKFVVLQGGPGFTKAVLTGKHGSLQFSSAGEITIGALTLLGIWRWAVFLRKHIRLTKAQETW